MQLVMHMVTIEDLMPQGHFLRKLEAALDLSFVYEETAPLYSKKYGRPAIDPVVIVKYLLVGFLVNEGQIQRCFQLSEEVLPGHQILDRYHVHRQLHPITSGCFPHYSITAPPKMTPAAAAARFLTHLFHGNTSPTVSFTY